MVFGRKRRKACERNKPPLRNRDLLISPWCCPNLQSLLLLHDTDISHSMCILGEQRIPSGRRCLSTLLMTVCVYIVRAEAGRSPQKYDVCLIPHER